MGFKADTITLLRHYAKTEGYPTGSRVIGGVTDKSDWDYVVLADNVMQICEAMNDVQVDVLKGVTNPEYACAFASFRFDEMNLIIVKGDEDLLAWRYATETCMQWQPEGKKARVSLFGDCLRRAYRTIGCKIKPNYWNSITWINGTPKEVH
jgi:hypothetical protein